jgi:hypothetical protein
MRGEYTARARRNDLVGHAIFVRYDLSRPACAEGRVTFSELAPGPYQLCLELSECRPIDVPATDVHTIELTR